MALGYVIPSEEASTVVEALVTNFFCRGRVRRELHSDQGHNFQFLSDVGGFVMPRSEQDMHHTPPTAVRLHGGTIQQND